MRFLEEVREYLAHPWETVDSLEYRRCFLSALAHLEEQVPMAELRARREKIAPKLERRFGRATLGFFVAAGGFSQGFRAERRIDSRGHVLVVCIGPAELQSLVDNSDRSEVLKDLHERAVIEGNGGS
jgi:hypothetical protein